MSRLIFTVLFTTMLAGYCHGAEFTQAYSWNEGEDWDQAAIPIIVRIYHNGMEVTAVYDNNVAEERTQASATFTASRERIAATARAEYAQGPRWVAETAKVTGDRVVATSILGGGYIYFQCTTAGTTGTAEPAWSTTPGATVNDGTVVWTVVDDHFTYWQAETAYSVNDIVYPTTSSLAGEKAYRCIMAGTSGITEPDWGAPLVFKWWHFFRRIISLSPTFYDDTVRWELFPVSFKRAQSDPAGPIPLEASETVNAVVPLGRSYN